MTQIGADDQCVFWERQPDEPNTAYQAFCTYRDMGLARSLRSAAAAFYQSNEADAGGDRTETTGSPESGTSGQVARFKEWSRTWMWTARVEAFDADEARKRSLRMQQDRIEMLDSHTKISKLGLNLAAKILYDCHRGESYFPPSGLPTLINSITSLHRLTLGEATERVETTGDRDQPLPDFSRLSDEEIDQMNELADKLYGGA